MEQRDLASFDWSFDLVELDSSVEEFDKGLEIDFQDYWCGFLVT
jgi:hypothetical protein